MEARARPEPAAAGRRVGGVYPEPAERNPRVEVRREVDRPFDSPRFYRGSLRAISPAGEIGGAGGIRTHAWRFCRPLP